MTVASQAATTKAPVAFTTTTTTPVKTGGKEGQVEATADRKISCNAYSTLMYFAICVFDNLIQNEQVNLEQGHLLDSLFLGAAVT